MVQSRYIAKQVYRKAVKHLAYLLPEDEEIHLICLKRKSQNKYKKKIAIIVYLY